MKKIKNVAIIAHVDHGKTTLVDKLLVNSGLFRDNQQVNERMMDSNDLEKEKGITILAKNTAIEYGDYKINILDTPGHADFGGEVERILTMVDGVLLVVDAYEGCMPQTRFVLKKAMEQHLKPIVIINKVDKPSARCAEVIDEVMDLLIELDCDEEMLDFPVVYASAVNNQSSYDLDNLNDDMEDIYDCIINNIEDAENDTEADFQMQVSLLDYNDFVGRIGVGRVRQGKMQVGKSATLVRNDGKDINFKIQKLFTFSGLNRVETDEVVAGDIVAIVGQDDINISETVCSLDKPLPLPKLMVEEPTLKMEFRVNDSPFVGKEGKYVTSRQIEDRLMQELKTDVSLRVETTDDPSRFMVSGRGELHLSVLIENMRRQGYEFAVSKPQVIAKEIDGVLNEPVEEVTIDVPDEFVGGIIENLGNRKAEMLEMKNLNNGTTRLKYDAYSRSIIGFTSEVITISKGYAIYSHVFKEYRPTTNINIQTRFQGVLVSIDTGKSTTYSMLRMEDRGQLIIEPGTEIYEGMVVGIGNKLGDLDVNVSKAKEQTNVRSANKDNTVVLKSPKLMTLEECIEFIDDDELLEVTPESIRIRKKYLNKAERAKHKRQKWDN